MKWLASLAVRCGFAASPQAKRRRSIRLHGWSYALERSKTCLFCQNVPICLIVRGQPSLLRHMLVVMSMYLGRCTSRSPLKFLGSRVGGGLLGSFRWKVSGSF